MDDPSTTEPSRERPSITCFSTEVLTMIVNQLDVYIIFIGPESKPKAFGFPNNVPPMALHPDLVAIRSVSRLFRVLVNQLPFWYTDDVHVTALLSAVPTLVPAEDPRQRSLERFPPWQSELKHLENHLQDKDWVRCLERRRKWRLRHPPLLFAILRLVPSFHRNATSIVFDFLDWSPSKRMYPGTSAIDTAIGALGCCRNLVSLEINHAIGQFSLDLIPVSCPGLKYLRIADPFRYPNRDHFRGNLDGLATLEDLDIRDFCETWDGDILPLSSAATLTRLTLLSQGILFWPEVTNFDRYECLNGFINLKSLSLSPLSREMAKSIISATFTLSDLRILLWDTADDDGEDMPYGEEMWWLMSNFDILMSSTSLSCLKEFRLAIIFPQLVYDVWSLEPIAPVVFGPIVRYHPHLEKLVLNADYGDSCFALLAQLVQLRSLVWHWPQPNILEADASVSEIKEVIRAAFEQTSTNPVIEVIPHDYHDHGLSAFEPLVYEGNGS